MQQHSPDVGSIEFVGTAAEFRGQGVASRLIQYILEHTPYQIYLIEEVADTNISAFIGEVFLIKHADVRTNQRKRGVDSKQPSPDSFVY